MNFPKPHGILLIQLGHYIRQLIKDEFENPNEILIMCQRKYADVTIDDVNAVLKSIADEEYYHTWWEYDDEGIPVQYRVPKSDWDRWQIQRNIGAGI